MGSKQKIQAEATDANNSGARGGRHPNATLHHVARQFFRLCLRLYFLLWTHVVFSVSAPYCIVFQGRLGSQIHVCSASLYIFVGITSQWSAVKVSAGNMATMCVAKFRASLKSTESCDIVPKTNSRNWVCLVRNILVDLPRVSCTIVQKEDRENARKLLT